MPKKDIYYPEEAIEAECHVSGYPVPSVEWVHGTGSINVSKITKNTLFKNICLKSKNLSRLMHGR